VDQNKFAPPGTMWVSGNIYMDIHEISNENWHEFYYSVTTSTEGSDSIVDYREILPNNVFPTDSSMIESDDNDTGMGAQKNKNNFFNIYYHHHYYSNYPVIMVSREKAQQFCAWRTKVVNAYLAAEAGEIEEYLPDHTYNDVKQRLVYRLPTKQEWDKAGQAGLESAKYPFGYEEIKNKNGTYKFGLDNVAYFNNTEEQNKYVHLRAPSLNGRKLIPPTYPVYYGKPNRFGLYNMPGNVSEYVKEDTIVKGLNWSDEMREYFIDENLPYKRPTMMIGFRCACETGEPYNEVIN